ncbi:UNVERIFIED_CONTAM: hypothetical protein RF653_08935 [Kocuria sp. CPCC 205316]|uniref:hypothetical protein n=1 Tax=Kocuria TaxID=57493 RepID=UPI0036DD7ACB
MTTTTMRIGLMADPGLPEKVAESVAADLSRELSDDPGAVGGAGVRWEVEVSSGALPLTLEGEIPLMERAGEIRDGRGWDYVVYLTDLPRVHDGQSVLCEVSSAARAALVVLPALGAYRLRRRIRRLMVALIRSVQEGTMDFPSASAAREAVGHGAVRRVPPGREGDVAYVVLPGRWNRLRLLSGMVRSNRPGRLLSALSSCVAAAAATGAFGIFYASIWNMSDALSVPRMAAISGVVIAALSAWLIVYNGLWNRLRDAADRWRAGLDNAATIITVGLSVALMYMVLWSALFVLGLAVITGDYLASQLGHPVSLFDYLHLSWLAASLGTLAGALGSNFDSDESIREATYSRRVHERRRLADDYQD